MLPPLLAAVGGTGLAPVDLWIILLPFVVTCGVALYMRRYLRSVADFLAASRCAGRYLICTAAAELGAAVTTTVVALEVFSKAGFSLSFWQSFTGFVIFVLTLTGFVTYRYRETRVLTFHQFFEVRYSKGLRVFASCINFFSAMFNFGILPGVAARFFVYFCGLPETLVIGGLPMPTFALLMVFFFVFVLFFTLTGGQISVMLTDCLEGVISGILYLVVAFAIIALVSYDQMHDALLTGPPGKSFINPLDIGQRADFNYVFVALSLLMSLYFYRGNAWNAGFAAAAASPHEGRMAAILGTWRGFGGAAMAALISVGAFTLLNHPDYGPQQQQVAEALSHIENPQLQTQMRMPVALGILLPAGIKGCFCAIALFGTLAGLGNNTFGMGNTFLQDVVLPFRKKSLTPKEHIRWLRISVFAFGLWTIFFSLIFRPVDYLVMVMALIGSIYLGGVGAVVLGGLYWKKGTTQGAWAAMASGASLAMLFWGVQTFWKELGPHIGALCTSLGWADAAAYLASHADRFPVNGQILSVITAATAATLYVVVSLLTCREDFNMDRMLHRGAYRLAGDEKKEMSAETKQGRSWLQKFLAIDANFTRGDKAISYSIFWWSIFWKVVALVVLVWNLVFFRWPDEWWVHYVFITGIWITLGVALFTTVWFTIGAVRDMILLFPRLEAATRSAEDDGRVQREPDEGPPRS